MINEEWLLKIEKTYHHENSKWILSDALRSIFELHKPIKCNDGCCVRCAHCYNEDGDFIDYPCQTIQAIEKELS